MIFKNIFKNIKRRKNEKNKKRGLLSFLMAMLLVVALAVPANLPIISANGNYDFELDLSTVDQIATDSDSNYDLYYKIYDNFVTDTIVLLGDADTKVRVTGKTDKYVLEVQVGHLTLDNVNIESTIENCVYISELGYDTTITLVGDNYLEASDNEIAVFSHQNLTIDGTGGLYTSNWIGSAETLTINSGSIACSMIYSDLDLTINGGDIRNTVITAYADLVINDGYINNEALESYGDLIINGGDINVNHNSMVSDPVNIWEDFTMTGGNLKVRGGIHANGDVAISGGTTSL